MPQRVLILCFFLLAPAVSAQTESRLAWRVTNLDRGETVNMRAGASPGAAILAKVPYDAGVLDPNGDCIQGKRFVWCPVKFNGRNGWIASKYLQRVRIKTRMVPVPPTEPAPRASDSPTPAPSADVAASSTSSSVTPTPTTTRSSSSPAAAPPAKPPPETVIKADREGLFFVYHQLEPRKRPTGCVAIDADKLPPVDQLEAQEKAIGKRELKTTCCKVRYLYFGRLSDCDNYLLNNDLKQGQETEPVTVPADN